MGCWNTTCFLTNLPIRAGEPIAVIPVVASTLAGRARFVYSHELFSPLAPAVFGEYDDYGGIDSVEACNPQTYLEVYCAYLEAAGVTAAPTSASELQAFFNEVLERGEGKLDSRIVSFVTLRKSVYDRLMADSENWTFSDWDDTKVRPYLERGLAQLSTLHAQGGCLDTEDEAAISFEAMMMEILRYALRKVFIKAFGYSGASEVRQYALEFAILVHAVTRLRKHWTPMPGEGSQDDSYRLQALFAADVLDYAEARRAEDKSDEEDDA